MRGGGEVHTWAAASSLHKSSLPRSAHLPAPFYPPASALPLIRQLSSPRHSPAPLCPTPPRPRPAAGTAEEASQVKKGFKLPRNIMTNGDLARLINSDEIQSVRLWRVCVCVCARLSPVHLAERRSEFLWGQ